MNLSVVLPALFFALIFWSLLAYLFYKGEIVDYDLEQDQDIVMRKALGLMDAAELAERQNSTPPLTAIDVFVPKPLEIENDEVRKSTIDWVESRLDDDTTDSIIRFWGPADKNATESQRAVGMIIQGLSKPERAAKAASMIKIVKAPDYLFMCDMTMHTTASGQKAFVNKTRAGFSDIFMELSGGESYRIAAAWKDWLDAGAKSKISFDAGQQGKVDVELITIEDTVVRSSSRVAERTIGADGK